MIWLLFACSEPELASAPVFVRTGVMRERFEARTWTPGERVDGVEAPRMAQCVALADVALGDLAPLVAKGISAPDTAMAWDPSGTRLAIGSYLGEVVVVDGWSGAVLARRTLAESAVKKVAWSRDGDELYAAEQSVDGWLRALDPETLEDRARFRMADALETSAPPRADDLFGLYTLPGAYGLEVDEHGIVLLGAHGWSNADGRRNRSQLWRLRRTDEGFETVAVWPEQPADATFLALGGSDAQLGVSVSRSSVGPPPPGIPVGGVQILDRETLRPVRPLVPEPLRPWFDKAFVWEAIGMHPGRVTLGLADGRIWRADQARDLSTPLLAGDVPIAATIGTLVDGGDALFTVTSGTTIPFGHGRPELQPPEAHPMENTLVAMDPESLATLWTWRGAEALHGLTVSDRWLVVGTGPKSGDDTWDRHGVMVFDRSRQGSGSDRLATSCSTGQPVFFRAAIAPDGRIAVASFPEKRGESVRGEYRVTLFL